MKVFLNVGAILAEALMSNWCTFLVIGVEVGVRVFGEPLTASAFKVQGRSSISAP